MKCLADQRCVEELRARLAAVRPDDVALWGKMSAGEMVVHLREAFRMASGASPAATMKGPLPPKVVKWLALRAPRRWPQNLPTLPELKRGRVGPPGDFERDCAGMQQEFEAFVRATENRTPHPIFGAMQPKDWMRWGYLHTDHHLRQFGR
jgi:hypothetical protein